MRNYDDGRAELVKLCVGAKEWLSESANEATVRFRLVDELLTNVLGWQKGNVEVERYDQGDYTDYECGSPAMLVVETKRASVAFKVPAGFAKSVCRIETLCECSDDVSAAIDQAISYCHSRSIQYGAVSNGSQIVFFVATRTDGVPARLGKALVFLSLEQMLERFPELWNAASPAGLKEGHLGHTLKGVTLNPPPLKLSQRIMGYPGHKNRNPIATELQILGGLFLEDLSSSPDLEKVFLEQTYCKSGALSQYAMVSKDLLRTRYSTFFEQQAGVSAEKVNDKKGPSQHLTADIFAASLSRRPILLVGDVGVGKTTFIRNFIRVDAKEELRNALVLYIDFGSKPAVADDLRKYALSEIIRQLRDEHSIDIDDGKFVRGVYNQRIQAFAKGIYGELRNIDLPAFSREEIKYIASLIEDRDEHLKMSLEHASKAQRRQIVVFLDNVDQRKPQFQEEVFLMSHAFAQNWPVTVFVALRPETFSLSKAKGTLAAYQPRVFTIDPPRVDQVVLKRLRFALTQLRNAGRLPGMAAGVTLSSRSLELYLQMLVNAFESRDDIIELIDNMCSGNVRRAMEYVSDFVGSGHVDSEKILYIIERSGSYTLPLHEFFRAVIHRDKKYYDPADSAFPNIFDISSDDRREHFATLIAMAFIEQAAQGGVSGYIERVQVYSYLRGLGFLEQQIMTSVQRLVESELVTTPIGLKGEEEDRLRITTAGAYFVKKLASFFAYLDAVVIDTPVTSREWSEKIQDQEQIDSRLDRSLAFLDYLDDCWTGFQDQISMVIDWPAMSASARHQIRDIQRKIS